MCNRAYVSRRRAHGVGIAESYEGFIVLSSICAQLIALRQIKVRDGGTGGGRQRLRPQSFRIVWIACIVALEKEGQRGRGTQRMHENRCSHHGRCARGSSACCSHRFPLSLITFHHWGNESGTGVIWPSRRLHFCPNTRAVVCEIRTKPFLTR